MNNIYFAGSFYTKSPTACQIDLTPPTFAGVQAITPNADGTFTVNWNIATDLTGPIKYNIYVALGNVSAASLFVASNITKVVKGVLSTRVFTLADAATYFINGQEYTFGVRAEDGVGQSETNIVKINSTAIGSGNLASLFQTIAASLVTTDTNLQTDHVNFQADNTAFIARIDELVAINNALVSRNSELIARNAELVADHASFQGDHTNFQTDNTNFQARNAELVARNAELVLRNAELVARNAEFVVDHANFQQDHANFQQDITEVGESTDGLITVVKKVLILQDDIEVEISNEETIEAEIDV